VIKSRLAGPDFVWLLPGWFRANWWAAVEGTDCNVKEMNKTLEHSLGGLGNGIVLNDPTRILVSHKVTVAISYVLIDAHLNSFHHYRMWNNSKMIWMLKTY